MKRIQKSHLLMISSLLLLLLLIFLWIGKLYNNEKNGIKKNCETQLQLDYTSLIKKNTKPFNTSPPEPIFIYVPEIGNYLTPDSIASLKATDNFESIVDSISKENRRKKDWAEAFIKSLNANDYVNVYLQENKIKALFTNLKTYVNKEYGTSVSVFSLEASSQFNEDSSLIVAKIMNSLEFKKYWAVMPNFRRVIFYRLLRQILFSALVFISTCITFLFVIKARKKQEQLAVLKSDFMNNITHELKTPISTLTVALEALSNTDTPLNNSSAKEYIDMSKKELNRLTALVDSTLKINVLENDEFKLALEPICLKLLLDKVLQTMNLTKTENNCNFLYNTYGNNFNIKGHHLHLTSVLHNLIENAIKYNKSPLTVKILLEEKEAQIKLTIEDDGIGIPTEYQNKVFDKFFRVPKGDVYTQGSGLGLYYVKGIIEKHHGTITVQSKLHKGTAFYLTLPKHH